MAQVYVDTDGTLVIPGAYPKVAVVAATGGVSTTGVLLLLGESETGPSYSDEDPTLNSFGPDQFSAVSAKFGSGPLVDAYRAAAAPSTDPQITGAPNRIFVVKTNVGSKSTLSLDRSGLGSYATLRAKSAGQLGNLIYSTVTQTAEVSPAISATVVPNTGAAIDVGFRVNGGAAAAVTQNTGVTPALWLGSFGSSVPATTPSSVFSAAGLSPTGCVNRSVLTVGTRTVTVVASGSAAVFTVSGTAVAWDNAPSVGDTLYISNGFAAANQGYWIVTAVTSGTIAATKLHNLASTVNTAPSNETFSPVATTDLQCFSPLTLTNLAGSNRTALGATSSLTVSAGASTVTVTNNTGNWAAVPQAGDVVFVPSNTGVKAISTQLAGWSRVVSATATTVVLNRISGGSYGGGATDAAVTAAEFNVYRPGIDGVGKSIELFRGGTAASNYFYNPVTFAVSAWDVVGASQLVTGTEQTATVNVSRQSDSIQDSYTVGGRVVLNIGYAGTSCSVNIGATSLVATPTGGSGSTQTALFKDFTTLKDLATWLNSKTGFTCSVAANAYNQLSPTALDRGVYTAGSSATVPNATALIKADAYYTKLAIANSSVVEFSVNPTAGLPDIQATTYFANGAKGATTDANVLAALAAAERVTCNFVIPLFSRDASLDVSDDLTDAASTYTISGVNASVLDHVVRMSQFKKRKPRQGFFSFRGTYVAAKSVAQGIAAARGSCSFQDVKALASTGSIKQFQPWYMAVLAAAFQAAGFYRPIFNKSVNCSGVVQAAGDWFDADDSSVEDALQAGLLVMRERPQGGFAFVSDQTTYGVDNNFVYNSIQAVYGADTIAMTIAQRMEAAFVGQSFSDVPAAVALSYLKGILADLRRLKLITPSDDAPSGYKNAKVTISAPAMLVEVEVKEGTGIYFIPVKVQVSQVQQTAQQ